jgi:hypothetical protein
MRKILLATAAALALCVHADAANWPSTSGSTVPGAVLEDGAGNKLTSKPTYRFSQSTGTFAATFTDVWVISGSASKTVRVNLIVLCAAATAATNLETLVVKHSTANTGGTSSSLTSTPNDSSNAASTGTVLNYTANPTVGTVVGVSGFRKLNVGTVGNSGCLTWTFGPPGAGQPIVLRGIAQQLAVSFSGQAVPSGLAMTIEIETTEE